MLRLPIDVWKDLIDAGGKMQAAGAIQISLSRNDPEINPAKEGNLRDKRDESHCIKVVVE